jgi:hypothetical protein
MSADSERFLERLTPRGAPPPLRQRVLGAVAHELAERPRSRRRRWVSAALAASLLLAVGLNFAVDQAQQTRLAALYGPEPVPQPLADVTRAVEEVADARTAAWFRQELLAAARRPARDAAWIDYYSRLLRKDWSDAAHPLENHENPRGRRPGAGGALFDRQRGPHRLHGRTA